MALWEVVGGADKGGILVREGQDLKSAQTEERLATGAVVEEVELIGDRLHYKVVAGTGPKEGWVSLKVSGKDLVVPKAVDVGGPADAAGPVEVDEELKKDIMAAAKKREGAFADYCFKYKVLGCPYPEAKFRVFCFHNAGSAESNFTGAGTPFLTWVKEKKQVEIVAFSYPGRDKLMKADKFTEAGALAADLLTVSYDKLADGVPYLVWGHSVGTWVAFEFLILARKLGLPMPKAAFLNAFPAPHMPTSKRPWRRSKTLNTAGIKEELVSWDAEHFGGAGKVVFDEPNWSGMWEPLMRADFQLYDEYAFKHAGSPKFEFPIHAWHMDQEKLNKADMIELWKDWTTDKFDHQTMKGMGHLTCFYKPDLKKEFFTKIVDLMKGYTGL